jgi:glyoxylase-like metal-dependent hydrolase (beta-lactamase superfamily II)
MAPQRVSPRVIVETENYGSNNSVVIGRDGLVLVDSPHRLTDARAWADFTATVGKVRFIVNTDHHPDHTIGNYLMPGEIVAHRVTRERLITEPPTMEYLQSLMARLDPAGLELLTGFAVRVPTVVFDTTATLYLEDATVELTHHRGHTRNNVLAYLPEDKVLFTGDIVCEAGLPSFQDSRLVDWFDALDFVETYDFEILVPGHGQVTDRAGVESYRQMGRAVISDVADRISQGQLEEQIVAELRFEDNIHIATPTCAGYPDDLIEWFQVRSISRVYQDVLETPGLAHR